MRGSRPRGGKSDQLDAIHAARTALINDHPATPRADGPREALRLLITTRQHYATTRTATINVFNSVILGATDLREELRHLTTDLEDSTRLRQLQALARTITDLEAVLATNYQQLEHLVRQLCPALLDLPGVGPTAPPSPSPPGHTTPASATKPPSRPSPAPHPCPPAPAATNAHRLNRGGYRTLNAALHTIVTTRRRMKHPATSEYITRRTAEGLTPKEILRCLKRYTARQLFRLMQATPPATT